MICACCGYEIKGTSHFAGHDKYVCDRCWKNPALFFPGKLKDDGRFKFLSSIAQINEPRSDSIEVDAIRLSQKDITLYVGKMRSKDVMELYDIDKFKEKDLKGYQRQKYEERTSELFDYLIDCPLAVMPGLFISLREEIKFTLADGDIGVLSIPRRKGSIWIIDGQHRVGGFERVRDRLMWLGRPSKANPQTFIKLMNYEFPVVFIDSRKTAEKIKRLVDEPADLSAQDVERAIFFIINKTQKGINPSLKDALLYRIKITGVKGIPTIEKEKWRVQAAYLGIELNQNENSPLVGQINISGERELGRPIQLNSFVSSLQKLFREEKFLTLKISEKARFLMNYWDVIKQLIPDAFKKNLWKEFMVLKVIGIYSLHWLASDFISQHVGDYAKSPEKEQILKVMSPLREFDWRSQTSPLAAFGGMKGVREAYGLLSNFINRDLETQAKFRSNVLNPNTQA